MRKIALFVLLSLMFTYVFAQKKTDRVALVIGNGAYKAVPINNSVNDAKAISRKLRKIGFTVTTLQDADLKQMQEALIALKDSSRNSDVGVLFYSGHGLGLDGGAYLIPVDATFTDEASAKSSSLGISYLLKDFLQSKRKIVFYDAELTNPFETYGARAIDSSPKNTLIAYAAMRGEMVLDGVGQKNSPFTTALLQHLDDPQDIAIVLRKVRERVVSKTNGKQEPWEYGSLTGGELILSRLKSAAKP